MMPRRGANDRGYTYLIYYALGRLQMLTHHIDNKLMLT